MSIAGFDQNESILAVTDENFQEEVLESERPVIVWLYGTTEPQAVAGSMLDALDTLFLNTYDPLVEVLINRCAGEYKCCKVNVHEEYLTAYKLLDGGLIPAIALVSGGVKKSAMVVKSRDVAAFQSLLDEILL